MVMGDSSCSHVDEGRGGDCRGWARHAGKGSSTRMNEVSGRIDDVMFAGSRDREGILFLGAAWRKREGSTPWGHTECRRIKGLTLVPTRLVAPLRRGEISDGRRRDRL